jgi:hypothetical protein
VIGRRLLAALSLLVAAASPLCAQPVATTDVQRVDLLLRDFERRGLPSDLLRAKVAEGVAKGATNERIVEAVTLLARRVDSVAQLLAPSASVPELRAGAEALAIGVTGESLRGLRRAAGQRELDSYVLLIVRLMRRGVAEQRAVRAARTLLARQAPPDAVLALGDDFARDLASGLEPNDALDRSVQRVMTALRGVPALTGDGVGVMSNTPTNGVSAPRRP